MNGNTEGLTTTCKPLVTLKAAIDFARKHLIACTVLKTEKYGEGKERLMIQTIKKIKRKKKEKYNNNNKHETTLSH